MTTSYSIFYSCDVGYKDLLSSGNWTSDEISIALVDHALEANATITRTGMQYSIISPYVNKILSLTNPNVYLNASNEIVFTHDRVVFIESGNLSGRFVFYILGNLDGSPSGSPIGAQDTDQIIGYVDLTGDGNADAVDAEFSFIPENDILFKIGRTS